MAIKTIPVLFGLAFDVEKNSSAQSGFHPAMIDLGAGIELFGYLRLLGFVSALRTGLAEQLVIAGGDEGRYKNETPVINRAEAIREMVVKDFGIDAGRVRAFASRSNTLGNIARFKNIIETENLVTAECAITTNLYHLPRTHVDLVGNGLSALQMYAAEAFWLYEDPSRKNELIRELGEGHLAQRVAEECQGIADKLRGTYASRTDVAAVNLDKVVRAPA